jgi:hypothetical protein
LDVCGTDPALIKKRHDILAKVQAECVMDQLTGYGLGAGISAACVKLVAGACLSPTP